MNELDELEQLEPEELEQLDGNTLRERILLLIADRNKKREGQERIQEKIRALNSELAARTVEAEELSEELDEIRLANVRKLHALAEGPESRGQAEEVRNIVLGEVLALAGDKFVPDQDITQIEPDETQLMVEKNEDTREVVDTVLILFHPTTDPELRRKPRLRKNNPGGRSGTSADGVADGQRPLCDCYRWTE
eukprot:g234.t1